MIGGFKSLVNPPSLVSEIDLDATRAARAALNEEVRTRLHVLRLLDSTAPGSGAVEIRAEDGPEDAEDDLPGEPGPVAA